MNRCSHEARYLELAEKKEADRLDAAEKRKAKSLIGLAESHLLKLEKALAEIGKVFREPGIDFVAQENKDGLKTIEKELRALQTECQKVQRGRETGIVLPSQTEMKQSLGYANKIEACLHVNCRAAMRAASVIERR